MTEEREKVVSLTGEPVGQPGRPDPKCIEALELKLEEARSGAIDGVAIITLTPDNCAGWIMGGRVGGYTMLGAAHMVAHTIATDNADRD